MLDALEVLVPSAVPRNHEIWRRFHDKRQRTYKTLPYFWIFDFRPALPALVHAGDIRSSNQKRGNFKIEFKDVLNLRATDFITIIQHLFSIDSAKARHLKVARVDFTVDVKVPVDWFREHARVLYKQVTTQYRKDETRFGVSTLQFGKRPDLYRIYDKVEQIRTNRQFQGDPRTKKPAKVLLVAEAGRRPIFTRVERQCTIPRVPPDLSTLGELLENAANFDPFKKIILKTGKEQPDASELKPNEWLMVLGLQAAIQEHGYEGVRAKLNRGGGNAARTFHKYSLFLNNAREIKITREALREAYRRSTAKQLNEGLNPLFRTFFPLLSCNINQVTSI